LQENNLQDRVGAGGLRLSSFKEKREKHGATLCLASCFGIFAEKMFHPRLYFLFSLFKPTGRISEINQTWGISDSTL
jgi:hypothetical protein